MFDKWVGLFLSLGSSFLEVGKAELEEIGQELGSSGKNLAYALGFFAAATALGFWTLGILTYGLVQVVAIWLPVWGAALALTAVFLLVIAALGLIGSRFLKRVENPRDNLRRHLDGHRDWWQNRLLAPRDPSAPEEDSRPQRPEDAP